MNYKHPFSFASRTSLLSLWFLVPALVGAQTAPDAGWANYGNDPGGSRYSTAKQIDRGNVAQLKVAWTYRTGALPYDEDLDKKAAFEATPILIDRKLFLSTPYDHVIALNAENGAKIWEFDPKLEHPYGFSEVTSRGVSAWRDASAKAGKTCALRIFIGTLDARLMALDGDTGKPCADFGTGGEIDLTNEVKLRDPGDYQVTSAPAIFKDLVITGSSEGDMGSHCSLGLSNLSAHRSRQCVVDDFCRCAARSGVYSDGKREPGLLRRISQGRQQVGQLGCGVASFDRRVCVGISGGAPRSLGL
jgi:hypothetical protein